MYETILIPTDGSNDAEKGVDHGIELAAAVGATVHALYVAEEGTNPWDSASIDDQQQEAEDYGQSILDDVATQAADAGVECVTAVEFGPRVYEEINEYVDEEDIDVIVMGSGYRGRLGGLLGSTAEKVLNTADVPVTVLRRGEFN